MAVYTYEVSAEHNIYPNITIYDRLKDGEPYGWRFNTDEGYVMYDTTANNTEYDPETGEEIPVTYYYTVYMASRYYNWNNFHWVAVPRDSVDENYIFGVDEPEHEVM